MSWRAGAVVLERGGGPGEAVRAAGLSPCEAQRILHRWSGGWVDLLDGLEGSSVLVLDRSPGRATRLLAERARVVGFVDGDRDRAYFRRSLVQGCQAEIVFVRPDERWPGSPWDFVVFDGRWDLLRRQGQARPSSMGDHLAAAKRVVLVADNVLSPLRALERVRGRPVGPLGPPSLGVAGRRLSAQGLRVRQRFALLRSSVASVTAFDLDAPRTGATVLRAAEAQVGDRARAISLSFLRAQVEAGRGSGVVPAWMLVASEAVQAWRSEATRPTGRLGKASSREAKIVRGDPPCELETIYDDARRARNEISALEALVRAGVGVAPKVLSPRASTRVRQSWMPGHPLVVHELRPAEICSWVGLAARTLGEVQAATRRPDGSVLVHGDFHLGNILTDTGRITAVVDWSEARWGGPDEDLNHLVASVAELRHGASVDRASLAGLAREERAGRSPFSQR